MKIATDACSRSEGNEDRNEIPEADQNKMCKIVLLKPQNLKNLDLKAYFAQLDMTDQGNKRVAIEHIINEFKAPFADPR